MNKSICFKEKNDGECCCTCRWHIKDFSHPETDGGNVLHQRGWICASPEFDGYFSGWSEHGLCELWILKVDDDSPLCSTCDILCT